MQRSVLCGTLDIPTSETALLRESTTEYGAAPSSKHVGTSGCDGPYLEIPFPANIASLRTEYARIPLTPQQENALGGGNAAGLKTQILGTGGWSDPTMPIHGCVTTAPGRSPPSVTNVS